MVKLSLACLALASAVKTEAPVISLDLSQTRHPYKLTKRIVHENAVSIISKKNVTSYQDYSVRCAAGTSTSATNSCPSPTASAYDHHDHEVEVQTRLYLVNQRLAKTSDTSNDANGLPMLIANGVIDYSKRATYLYKYDATDESGNDAEQVVFALILDDLEAPTIQYDDADKSNPVLAHEQIIEASSDWKLDSDHCFVHAEDNIDGDVSQTLVYKVEKLYRENGNNVFRPMWTETQQCCVGTTCQNSGDEDCYQAMGAAANIINTSAVCDTCKDVNDYSECNKPACVYRVTIKANDYAHIYGHDGQDNQRTHAVTLEVRDTRKPVIHVLGKSPKAVECDSTAKYQELFSDGKYRESGSNTSPEGSCNTNNHFDYCGAGAHVRDLLETEIQDKTIDYTVASNVNLAVANANYTVTFSAEDESDNQADDMTRTVMVIDTTKPTLSVIAANTGAQATAEDTVYMYTEMDHNCDQNDAACRASKQYTAANAKTNNDQMWSNLVKTTSTSCDDECTGTTVTYRWSMVETTQGEKTDTDGEAHRSGIVNGHLEGGTPWHTGPGTYVQTFTCTDAHGNTDEAARTYVVEDNEQPMIKLNDQQHSVVKQASRESEYTDSGATCTDFSDGEIDHQVVISGDVVNMRVPGTYKINFDCEDSSGNAAATVTRTVVVEDTTCPVLSLHGQNPTTVEAGFPYEDVGATATDSLDGDLTAHIITSGSLSSSHFLTMKSCDEIKLSTEHSRSPSPHNGMYNIVTQPTGKDHRHQVVFCDFTSSPALTIFIAKTEIQVTPYAATVIGSSDDKCSDYGLVMADKNYVQTYSAQLKAYAHDIDGGNCDECVFPSDANVWPATVTTDYFCKETATADLQANDSNYNNHYKNKRHHNVDRTKGTSKTADDIDDRNTLHQATKDQINTFTNELLSDATANSGTFTITYRVKDYAGNGCSDAGCGACSVSEATRNVVVEDTLPPVITLTLRNKLIQTSDASKLGVGGEYNPAGRKTVVSEKYSTHYHNSPFKPHKAVVVEGNPFLDAATVSEADHLTAHGRRAGAVEGGYMAEQTATNGWIIAAAASAVAGVALMGYSMKTAPVTVPV